MKNNNERLIFYTESRLCRIEKSSLGIAGRSSVTSISSHLRRRSSMLERPVAGDRREFFLLCLPNTLCSAGRLPKRARKNSSLEEDGINALCPLIGQCVAESLGRGIDSWEKIDLWLLQASTWTNTTHTHTHTHIYHIYI